MGPSRAFRKSTSTHRSLLVAVFVGLTASALCVHTALAHEKVEVGPNELEIGWLDEPPLVGEKNAVFVGVVNSETGLPAEDISTIRASISMGGRSKDLLFRPLAEDKPGQYVADLIPTVRGVYTVRLSGTLGAETVDFAFDLDEVEKANALQFPEPAASTLELQERLAEAESALRSTQTAAYVALAVGGAGLAAAVVSLFRRNPHRR